MNKELEKYIKEMWSRGFTSARVIKELKKAGWQDEQVVRALNLARETFPESEPAGPAQQKTESKSTGTTEGDQENEHKKDADKPLTEHKLKHTPKRSEAEDKNLKELVEKAQSLEELHSLIDKIGNIEEGEKVYTPDFSKGVLKEVAGGKKESSVLVPTSYGLRAKVDQLMKSGQHQAQMPPKTPEDKKEEIVKPEQPERPSVKKEEPTTAQTKESAPKEEKQESVKNPEELLKNSQNFEELYNVLDQVGDIGDSSQVEPYTPEQVKSLIESIRGGQGNINDLTITYNLRSVVRRLLWREKIEKAQSFDELYKALDEIGSSKVTSMVMERTEGKQIYAPEYNKNAIEGLRKGEGKLTDIMPVNLRNKVKELLAQEGQQGQQENNKETEQQEQEKPHTHKENTDNTSDVARTFVEDLAKSGEVHHEDVGQLTEEVAALLKKSKQKKKGK